MFKHDEPAPAFHAPKQSCDAHFHVFGPREKYPYGSDQLRYDPPFAPLDEYISLAHMLGFERMVFVQPSAYGRDNSCMLDAMAKVGTALCRGIVDVDEHVPDAELARLHALGVRGVRINVRPIEPFRSGLGESLLPRIERFEARFKEIGWHLDFLLPDWLTAELMPRLRKLRVPFSLAHMGMSKGKDSVSGASFTSILDTLRHGEGQCWVKLTGCYRISNDPHYQDLAPMARALIEVAPDRLIWGSDYPHLSFGDRSTVELFNLLFKWASDESTRKSILVNNPAALFGF